LTDLKRKNEMMAKMGKYSGGKPVARLKGYKKTVNASPRFPEFLAAAIR
jgi:hypothetical protein